MSNFNPKEYWDSRLSKEYSLKGVGDIGLPFSYSKFLYKVRESAFRYAMKSSLFLIKDGVNSVLDVGSGTGFYIEQWKKQGVSEIFGSDITDIAVSNLRKKYSEYQFIKQDIGSHLRPNMFGRKFDVVTAFDMLFHIVDDDSYKKAIENFSLLVKDGGILIFSDNLSPLKKIVLEHQVSRTEKEVFGLLRKNGFEIIRIIPMFVFMNDPVRSKSRILRKFFSIVYRMSSRSELHGRLIGCFLYPIEIFFLKLLKRGPSTEIFIWRRVS